MSRKLSLRSRNHILSKCSIFTMQTHCLVDFLHVSCAESHLEQQLSNCDLCSSGDMCGLSHSILSEYTKSHYSCKRKRVYWVLLSFMLGALGLKTELFFSGIRWFIFVGEEGVFPSLFLKRTLASE